MVIANNKQDLVIVMEEFNVFKLSQYKSLSREVSSYKLGLKPNN
jgi:hypothetical protein